MIGKKINQLATELAPTTTDLTIIGDPVTGVSKKITLEQLGAIFGGAVSFYTNLASFPATGVIDIIYCAKDTQKLYLWSGSAYVEVFPSQALLDTYQLRSEKGNANGYASLDSLGKVPISQLPSSIMEYKGTWNAATNTPTLANGTGDTGDVYICNVAGTVNFGAGPITFAVGDYVIYSGTIWQRSSGAVGTVTSVAASITGDSVTISGSPVTTSGTLAFAFNGTTAQYIRGNGTLETFPSLTGFVPYTGATANVDLGTHTLLAAKGIFSSSGSGDTVGITHSSGSGIALNITKGGNGEGLYINKTSGSGNAATIIGTLNATTLVKSGGTSSQFLKADGSVDSTAYGTGSVTSVGLSSSTSGVTIGSTPITTSGTITLSIATASGSQQGLLSSTDWTTFNNKQNALTNPVTGTGTNNYIPKFTTTGSTIGNSQIFDNGTNVGIGTILPQANLQVLGTIKVATGNAQGILALGEANGTTVNVGIWRGAENAPTTDGNFLNLGGFEGINFATGNAAIGSQTTRLTIASTGAATFSSSVTIQGGNSLIVNNAANTRSGSFYTSADGTEVSSFNGAGEPLFLKAPSSSGNIRFITNGDNTTGLRMLLNASGNLSIGNTNDTYKLDVTGTGRFGSDSVNGDVIIQSNATPLIIRGRSPYQAAGLALTWDISPNTGLIVAPSLGFNTNATLGSTVGTRALTLASTGAATFSSSVTSTLSSGIFLNNSSGGTNATQIRISNTGGDARMGVESSTGGTIQIGTSAYSAVFGNQANAATEFTTNGTVRMTILGGGNVGIGTANPNLIGASVGLSINNATDAVLELNRGNSRAGFLYSDATRTILAEYRNLPLIFFTNDTERMRITSGGNVEINTGSIKTGAPTNGTAQPWKLGNAVSGSISTNSYIIVSVNGTTYSIPALNGLP
jgi:hypothetical protein